MQKKFKNIELPVFFPDATRAVLKTLDSMDIRNTHTNGILVNTYHLYLELGEKILKKHKGVKNFMNWQGEMISDSGGFQVMSLVKKEGGSGKVTDEGVVFHPSKSKKIVFTPEMSIKIQMEIMPDMCVVLDDFTSPDASYKEAKESVERTIAWAKRSKDEFEKICKAKKLTGRAQPYLLAVVQGGYFQDLRKYCAQELSKTGFDGFGYGGWPLNKDGSFDYESAKTIAENAPDNYFLYGLGIGKPEEVVNMVKLGFNIFDCVLPTRDARHKRLYIFNADSIEKININKQNFYKFLNIKNRDIDNNKPVSEACDCLLCQNYSVGYLAHLFKIGDSSAFRLATIHNLRFYSLLMEKLKLGN